jgi:hypothetical protein
VHALGKGGVRGERSRLLFRICVIQSSVGGAYKVFVEQCPSRPRDQLVAPIYKPPSKIVSSLLRT